MNRARTDLGIASLLIGIAGFFIFLFTPGLPEEFWLLWIVPGLLAAILGAIAWRRDGDRLGLAGLTLGMIQVVLFGGSIAAYYSTGIFEPEPVTIAGTATLDNTNDELFFTPAPGLSPAPMTDSWEWTVERGGTTIMSWTGETTDMKVGETITLSTSASAVSVGDELKIKVGKRVFVTSIGAE